MSTWHRCHKDHCQIDFIDIYFVEEDSWDKCAILRQDVVTNQVLFANWGPALVRVLGEHRGKEEEYLAPYHDLVGYKTL